MKHFFTHWSPAKTCSIHDYIWFKRGEFTCVLWQMIMLSCLIVPRWLEQREKVICFLPERRGQHPGLCRPSSYSSSSVCRQLCGHSDPWCVFLPQIPLHRPPGVSHCIFNVCGGSLWFIFQIKTTSSWPTLPVQIPPLSCY